MNELVVILSRVQFAFTVAFHFLMVPLTIGLILLVATFEILHFKTKKKIYLKLANFWGNIFAINFVVGIVTGITMEIQFGTNWAEYSKFMGDIFGSPLALEALMAFFLESTFAGIWIFYRHKISAKFRAISAVLIAIGTHISAIWIITANGFMQNPVGYKLSEDGTRVILTNFAELATNPYAWYMLIHTLVAAYLLGGFFVLGVSAYNLLKKRHVEFFKTSVKFGLILAISASILLPGIGHFYSQYIADIQPAKAAAFEMVWETEDSLPMHLIQIPLPSQEKNIDLLPIPYVGSFMYTNSFKGEVVGIKDAIKDWTPEMKEDYKSVVPIVHYSFRVMVMLGGFFVLISLYALWRYKKGNYENNVLLNKILLYSLPLPWIAITTGWMVAEMGRQPFIVYNLMLTKNAASQNIAASQVLFSIITIFVFYGLLFFVDFYLIKKHVKLGPVETPVKKEVE